MKEVKRRTWFCLLFALILAVGSGIFLFRYVTNGSQWAAFAANRHVHSNSGQLSGGRIYDRNGTLLYNAASGDYNDDATVRKATLHAVGDAAGNIATGAKIAFQNRLCGWNPIFGTTNGGNDLYLTLDAKLNAAAYEAAGSSKCAIGVYNYKTGDLLCMVSTPTFDPENPPDIQDGDSRYDGVYLNRFISSTFTPGSTFKLVTAAAAIETMDDLFQRTFTCTGAVEIGGDSITCPSVHGTMDIYGAMAQSCNGTFATLAEEIGGKTLWAYAKNLGLLDSISINGIQTAAGSFTAADSGTANLGWSGVGQYNDLVNPCAMMVLAGAIANDGTAVEPHLIARVTAAGGLPVPLSGSASRSGTVKADTCRQLTDMMRNNVTDHYGQENFGDLAICAKSGTAEVGDGLSPHSWFVGFIDDDAHPLAFVVFVENGGSGARVAGSIASKLLSAAVDMGY